MNALGIDVREVDICDASMQMLRDIQHPAALGEEVWDVTYENVQAGARTSLLFRMANQLNGMVLGTGDLSELALGWSTYGVGDQMSHYSVNASVPKTLVKYIIEAQAMDPGFSAEIKQTLMSIVETPITPELIPIMNSKSTSSQLSEDSVGPFELQDFYLYFTTRYGFTPAKLLFLASQAWGTELPSAQLEHWLRVFNTRFFGQSQFKRSSLPNGPKVGNGGNLSPRSDWRAPADLSHDLWVG
jgi:NAD+ synthase (glutamine-hydrolysing)